MRKRMYFDHSAATPIDIEVLKAMSKIERDVFANASAIHKDGAQAKKILETARADIAGCVGARAKEIVFTGSGTEANNLALLGSARFARKKYGKDHIILSKLEHPSIIECGERLKKEGFSLEYLGVSKEGMVDMKSLKALLRPKTALVSVIYANNEIGAVQPLREVAKILRKSRKKSNDASSQDENDIFPLLHTDACQAMNYLDVNVLRLGVDLMSWNSSKIYGPKGVGALFVSDKVELEPIIYGGGQENGFRSGTEDLARIVGFSEAMKKTREISEKESVRLTKLRDFFIDRVRKEIPKAILNGSSEKRLPNNVNFSFLANEEGQPGKDAEEVVLRLDAMGISTSTRSACSSMAEGGSYVVRALGEKEGNTVYPYSSVRFSLGRETSKADLCETIKALKKIFEVME